MKTTYINEKGSPIDKCIKWVPIGQFYYPAYSLVVALRGAEYVMGSQGDVTQGFRSILHSPQCQMSSH